MPIAQIEIPWKQAENQWRQRERTPKTNEQPPLAIDTRTEQCLQTHRTSSCRGRGTRSVTIGLPFMLGEIKKTGVKRGLQAGACQSRRPGVSTAGHTHERPRAPQQARPAQRRVGKGGPPVDRYWKLKMELKKESKAMRSPRRRPYTSPFPSVCPYLVQRLLRACMTPHCLSERLLECMFCGSAGEGPMRPCCIERAVNRISSQTAQSQSIVLVSPVLQTKPPRQQPAIGDTKHFGAELSDCSASSIVLYTVLCSTTATQSAEVPYSVALLESPGRAPSIPCRTEHCRNHPGRDQASQTAQALFEAFGNHPLPAGQLPSSYLFSNSEMGRPSVHGTKCLPNLCLESRADPPVHQRRPWSGFPTCQGCNDAHCAHPKCLQ